MKAFSLILIFVALPSYGQFWKPADDITSAVGTPTPHQPQKQGTVVHKSHSGATLSRTPYPSTAPTPVAEDFAEKLSQDLANACLEALRPSFFDPPSARLEGYQTYRMPDNNVGIVIRINGKNRFGGYVGAKPYHCYKNGDHWVAKQGSW